MILRKWEDLPDNMKCPEVRKYYDILTKKRGSLVVKRLFDIVMASMMLVILLPIMLVLGIAIKMDSKGPILFKQIRITQYGSEFKILKFRSMVNGADKGSRQLTTHGDMRVTRVGSVIRNLRVDELPQLINIIIGDMSFVGTRPEVPRYVNRYTNEMLATLLLPAGVTSEASILFKNEYKILSKTNDVGKAYIEKVLPGKMYYNLRSIEHFSFWHELRTMVRTVFAVLGKKYTDHRDIEESVNSSQIITNDKV